MNNKDSVFKFLAHFLDFKIKYTRSNSIISFTSRSLIRYLQREFPNSFKTRKDLRKNCAYMSNILQKFVEKGFLNSHKQAKKTTLYFLDLKNEKHRKLIENIKNINNIDEIVNLLKKIYFE